MSFRPRLRDVVYLMIFYNNVIVSFSHWMVPNFRMYFLMAWTWKPTIKLLFGCFILRECIKTFKIRSSSLLHPLSMSAMKNIYIWQKMLYSVSTLTTLTVTQGICDFFNQWEVTKLNRINNMNYCVEVWNIPDVACFPKSDSNLLHASKLSTGDFEPTWIGCIYFFFQHQEHFRCPGKRGVEKFFQIAGARCRVQRWQTSNGTSQRDELVKLAKLDVHVDVCTVEYHSNISCTSS